MTERTLKDVSQRNPAEPRPDSDDVFGRMFQRGPSVAADGGERGVAADPEGGSAGPEGGTADGDEDADETPPVAEHRMKDVDQTPPDEDASANRVWKRGGEPGVDDASGDSDGTAEGRARDDGDANGAGADEASDE